MRLSFRKRCRLAAAASALVMLGWACGPPEMVPVVMPGSKPKVVVAEHEAAQARGEQDARGTVQPTTEQVDASIAVSEPTEAGKPITTTDGVKYETVRQGAGVQAKPGSVVSAHYDGTLTNGAQFDSSRGSNKPLRFQIGVTPNLIRGMHLAISGMRVGEIRRVTIPPALAYRDEGMPGVVPPNATLVFEIELLSAE